MISHKRNEFQTFVVKDDSELLAAEVWVAVTLPLAMARGCRGSHFQEVPAEVVSDRSVVVQVTLLGLLCGLVQDDQQMTGRCVGRPHSSYIHIGQHVVVSQAAAMFNHRPLFTFSMPHSRCDSCKQSDASLGWQHRQPFAHSTASRTKPTGLSSMFWSVLRVHCASPCSQTAVLAPWFQDKKSSSARRKTEVPQRINTSPSYPTSVPTTPRHLRWVI